MLKFWATEIHMIIHLQYKRGIYCSWCSLPEKPNHWLAWGFDALLKDNSTTQVITVLTSYFCREFKYWANLLLFKQYSLQLYSESCSLVTEALIFLLLSSALSGPHGHRNIENTQLHRFQIVSYMNGLCTVYCMNPSMILSVKDIQYSLH